MNESKDNVVPIDTSHSLESKTSILKKWFGFIDLRDPSLIPLQIILAIIAIIEAVNGFSDILSPSQTQRPHVYAHLGVLTLSYAISLLAISIRPARARGMLLFVTVAAFGFAITSVIDVINGRAGIAGESGHLTKFIAPFIVWIIASRVIYYSKTTNRETASKNTDSK